MNKKNKNKGFSLIELIIAIAILVILTGLLAPQFMKYIEKSREAKDMQALDTVYTAVQGALTDETAYNDFIEAHLSELTKEKGYAFTLASALGDGTFGTELGELLGTGDIGLNSKKATQVTADGKTTEKGVICINVKYTEGTPAVADDPSTPGDESKAATYGGFAISVYCGNDAAVPLENSLGIVGTPLK